MMNYWKTTFSAWSKVLGQQKSLKQLQCTLAWTEHYIFPDICHLVFGDGSDERCLMWLSNTFILLIPMREPSGPVGKINPSDSTAELPVPLLIRHLPVLDILYVEQSI